MKILAVSDEECAALWDYYTPGKLDDIDLIISCGDLNAAYLSFLVTVAKCPVLYVAGNHDVRYQINPPEGCDPIDDHFVMFNGVRIIGLGGCRKYHPGPYQYTEWQMRHRIRKLRFRLWRHKGVDIVVTHAAPAGLGDAEDPAHWGFQALTDFLDKYRPAFLLHGHVHVTYGQNVPREINYNGTRVINAFERYIIEIPEKPHRPRDHGQVIYKTHYHPSYLDE
ncbi:MAG: metallophosphoesterase [Ruminococcaceae bacterium]|nr:metallophosphoesterase [Oscillospiraceae bacterium]